MSTLPAPPVTTDLKSWACWAAEVGAATNAFKVFPCRPGEKKPLHAGWQDEATCDSASVAAMWTLNSKANIGLAIQPGFVALDYDTYKPGAAEAFAEFTKENGELPETLEFQSARGGYHMIYSTTRLLGNGVGSLPKLGEVRGSGGYIVGPGSEFEGKLYRVDGLCLPVPLPHHVDMRLSVKAAGTREIPEGMPIDGAVGIARFTTYLLEHAGLSVEGQGGNNMLAKTGAMGWSHALSEEKTLELMAEHWNPRCSPPWDDSDLEYFGGSGYRTATSRCGNVLPREFDFKPIARPGADRLFWTMADIPGPAPPREWALGSDEDGWIPKGDITLLYGPGGAGKTTLGGQMALTVARGGKLFGSIPCIQMPVLLIACEESVDELHRRFEKQGRHPCDQVTFASVVGHNAALHHPFRGPVPDEDTWLFMQINYQLASMPDGPKLVILDNLAHLYHGDYHAPFEIASFLNLIRRLIAPHDATVLLFAHPAEGQAASGAGGYGGIGWSAGVRSRLYFDRHQRRVKDGRTTKQVRIGDERILSRKKANMTKDHDTGEGVVLDWNNYNFELKSSSAANREVAFKPVVPAEAPPAPAAESAVLPIIISTMETILASNKLRDLSTSQLADQISVAMGRDGHRLTGQQIRKKYLPEVKATGHPAADMTTASGRWRHATPN